jgi:hypothetical protein
MRTRHPLRRPWHTPGADGQPHIGAPVHEMPLRAAWIVVRARLRSESRENRNRQDRPHLPVLYTVDARRIGPALDRAMTRIAS